MSKKKHNSTGLAGCVVKHISNATFCNEVSPHQELVNKIRYLGYLKHFRADKVIESVVNGGCIPESWEYDLNKCKMIVKDLNYEEVSSNMGMGTSPV